MSEGRFGRKYRLRIGKIKDQIAQTVEKVIDQGVGGGKITTPSADLQALPSESDVSAVLIENLHIVANLPYSKKSTNSASAATIQIYNLSHDTLKRIQPESSVILEAGYESDNILPMVYVGQIASLTSYKQNGTDRVTKLVLKDGYTVDKNVRLSVAFTDKTYEQIITELLKFAAQYGIPTGAFYKNPQSGSKEDLPTIKKRLDLKPQGFSKSGWLMDILSSACEAIGFRCYLSLGKLYVEPKEYEQSLEVLELRNNLIVGDLEPEKTTSNSLTGAATNKVGLKVTTLLDGRITLNKKIRIVEGDFKGYYDIEEMSHSLSYEGNEWYTIMDLVEV